MQSIEIVQQCHPRILNLVEILFLKETWDAFMLIEISLNFYVLKKVVFPFQLMRFLIARRHNNFTRYYSYVHVKQVKSLLNNRT